MYFAENRVYSGYDATLQTGPYNFGFGNTQAGLGRAVPVPERHARLVRQR